jgi:hypothetical protein
MASLEDIVDLSISFSAQSPSRATFAVPLILGYHTKFAEVVRTYRKLARFVRSMGS